jgi:hypothetical protein
MGVWRVLQIHGSWAGRSRARAGGKESVAKHCADRALGGVFWRRTWVPTLLQFHWHASRSKRLPSCQPQPWVASARARRGRPVRSESPPPKGRRGFPHLVGPLFMRRPKRGEVRRRRWTHLRARRSMAMLGSSAPTYSRTRPVRPCPASNDRLPGPRPQPLLGMPRPLRFSWAASTTSGLPYCPTAIAR